MAMQYLVNFNAPLHERDGGFHIRYIYIYIKINICIYIYINIYIYSNGFQVPL